MFSYKISTSFRKGNWPARVRFCLRSFPTCLLLMKQRARVTCCTGVVILLWSKWTPVVAWPTLLWVRWLGLWWGHKPLQCPPGLTPRHQLKVQTIGYTSYPGPHLQHIPAESCLQHTAGTHCNKSKINLQSKSPLDHHEKQRKTPNLLYKILNSTLFKPQNGSNNTVFPLAKPQLVFEP